MFRRFIGLRSGPARRLWVPAILGTASILRASAAHAGGGPTPSEHQTSGPKRDTLPTVGCFCCFVASWSNCSSTVR